MTVDKYTLDLDLSAMATIDQFRLTQALNRSSLSSITTRRLDNRNWRLLHCGACDPCLACDHRSLDVLGAPLAFPKSAVLSEKPLQFANNTLFSHTSKLSLDSRTCASSSTGKSSGAVESSSSESSTHKEKLKDDNKNIFFIAANSPSPTEKADLVDAAGKAITASTAQAPQPSQPPQQALKRQDSLFNNQFQNLNYSSSDLSDDGIDEDDEDEYTDEEAVRSHSSKPKTDDDSEWMSVSSDDEKSNASLHPLNFSKRAPPSRHVSCDTLLPAEEAALSRPRSLLSGLFLNELAKQHEVRPTTGAGPKKPILKRSSTTGIITIGQDKDVNDRSRIQRPSILFAKKFTSMTDISKKYPHFKNPLVAKDILYDEMHENENENDGNDGLGALNKQKSIVGVSDFNAVSNELAASSSSHLSPHNSSSLLSSSLNKLTHSKMQRAHSSHSFKNLISRSSVNLSGIFNTRRARLSHTTEILPPQSPPALNIDSKPLDHPKPEEFSSHKPSSIDIGRRFGDEPARTDAIQPKTPSRDIEVKSSPFSPKTTRRAMLESELSKSLKDSIIIDYRLGKIPLPTKVVSHEAINLTDSSNDYNYDDYHAKGW